MATIKCKMCGGDIELTAEKNFGTCESCGSTVTLPKIDDEQRAAAFNRGNHFRRSGEFDKALAVYERIISEDDSDAEAHWCCAICRFGIEYVEDPTSYEWLPTCHRASFDSFLEDVDYLAAVEHSDGITRRQYQRDAVKIAEVQRGILATSRNEEPFDVFICYKESDAAGNRTVDSTLAQDIYYQLTESGYRVFFARITLEDKGGTEYEPYIFAALNSAKIMVAVGTKPEHFNAVWVKNEWSRFLAMMRHDRSKLLLPCYRDMDPYDLPEQLSVLQSYDMGKIGFVQDLLRGIKKILDSGKKPEPVKETIVVQQGSYAGNVDALLKRGNMALEDGDWARADEFFEEVLNQNAECAEAYVGKTLAAENCTNLDALMQKHLRRTEDAVYKNANIPADAERINNATERYYIRNYLSKEQVKELYTKKYVYASSYEDYPPTYKTCVESRKAQRSGEERWWNEHKQLSRAMRFASGDTAQKIKAAYAELMLKMDGRISEAEAESVENKAACEKAYADFLDAADVKAEKAYETASSRREQHYQLACEAMVKDNDASGYERIAKDFDGLPDYKDSKERAEVCRQKAAAWIVEQKAEKERQRILKEKADRERAAKAKKTVIIFAAAAAVITALIVVLTVVVIPAQKYTKAETMLADGSFMEAAEAFEAMGEYKDAAQAADYAKGNYLLESARNRDAAAMEMLEALNEGKETPPVDTGAQNNQQDHIQTREMLEEAGLDKEATLEYFVEIDRYTQGDELWAEMHASGRGDDYARNVLLELGYPDDYITNLISVIYSVFNGDAEAFVEEVWLKTAVELTLTEEEMAAEKLYEGAYEIFVSLGSYRDSAVLAETAMAEKAALSEDKKAKVYSDATGYLAAGDYDAAIACFTALGDYKDSAEKVDECEAAILDSKYSAAVALLETEDYLGALAEFNIIGDYKDSEVLTASLRRILGFNEAVSARYSTTVALKSDGTVLATGYNEYGQCDVDSWRDIVAVCTGGVTTVGLKSNGTVVAVGDNQHGQCNVGDWMDIVSISAGNQNTVGLKSDGTVVAVGNNKVGQCDVDDWSDIVAISTSGNHTVGLKSDGTVIAVGENHYGQCNVVDWTDIVAVSAGTSHTVGLRSDGTVVAVGSNVSGQCDIADWTDIVAVSAGYYDTVGLKLDGNVVAAGDNDRCNGADWTDIVAISAGSLHTVGVKSDGTVVAVGDDNRYGQCEVSDWTNIKLP